MGGPNPDSWYRQQEALQKKIVARMRELGIEPVFPGYAGMVPRSIGEKLGYQIADSGLNIIVWILFMKAVIQKERIW